MKMEERMFERQPRLIGDIFKELMETGKIFPNLKSENYGK